MGGKSVKLERSLLREEEILVDEILTADDKSARRTMIAFIMKSIVGCGDNKTIANQVLDQFVITASKDPVGTTRSLVMRVIHDLNEGKTAKDIIKSRGRGSLELTRWTDSLFRQRLIGHHNQDPETFTYTNLKQSDFKLLTHIEQYRGNFMLAMREVGINPLVHLEDVPWVDNANSKVLLKLMIKDIESRCGIDSLNYHSMISHQSAILGIEENAHQHFPECKKFGCIRRVPGASIVKRMTEVYGSYKEGVCDLLPISSDDYEDLIERKPHEVTFKKYLDRLRNFIDEANDDWTIADFMRADRGAHHGLYNKKENLQFLERVHGDVMVAAVLQINFEESLESESTFLKSVFDDLVRETKSRRVSNLQIRLEGYRFQALFLDMLIDVRVGLVKNQDFIYERYIDRDACERLGHTPHCKVDFGFPDFIIDTKTSVTAGRRIANQTLRYLDHTNHLIRVTLRQRHRTEIVKSKQLTTMTIYEFIDQSDQYIGRSIPGDWIDKFRVYEMERSARIQEALGDQRG